MHTYILDMHDMIWRYDYGKFYLKKMVRAPSRKLATNLINIINAFQICVSQKAIFSPLQHTLPHLVRNMCEIRSGLKFREKISPMKREGASLEMKYTASGKVASLLPLPEPRCHTHA